MPIFRLSFALSSLAKTVPFSSLNPQPLLSWHKKVLVKDF